MTQARSGLHLQNLSLCRMWQLPFLRGVRGDLNHWIGITVLVFTRFLLLVARAVPEPIWALLFLFVLFPGILPGAIALGLHNFGILRNSMSPRNERLEIFLGCLLVIGINIAVIFTFVCLGFAVVFASCFFGYNTPSSPPQQQHWINSILIVGSYLVFSIGVLQLLYVIPLILLFKRQQKWGMMKGMIIGAVLTALLNAVIFIR